jgi:proteic killer suppression protein
LIKTFRHKGLKWLFEDGTSRGQISKQWEQKVNRRLDSIDAATQVSDLNLPGYDLHELKGKREGTWSITVTGNYRITFSFENSNAFDVDIEDYH